MLLYVDNITPRIDGRDHEPTNMTVGKLYEELFEDPQFYTVINDKGRRARYLKIRFVVSQLDVGTNNGQSN